MLPNVTRLAPLMKNRVPRGRIGGDALSSAYPSSCAKGTSYPTGHGPATRPKQSAFAPAGIALPVASSFRGR